MKEIIIVGVAKREDEEEEEGEKRSGEKVAEDKG